MGNDQAGALGQWADVIKAQGEKSWPSQASNAASLGDMLNGVHRDLLLQQWQSVSGQLAALKEREADLRKQCVAAFFGQLPEGTQNHDLGRGYTLKAVGKINYNLGESTEVVSALEKIAGVNEEGRFIAARLVKWKPELSISEYRKLPEIFKRILDTVLTTKPATPQLEIIEPKGA
jgi:hypothetical protein